ncbi:hypothetical protein [Pontibacter virosus]|nr:hypothetical protein [Pontibacter virosus]
MINLKAAGAGIEKPFISDEYLTRVITYHKEHPAFAKRPLTTYLTEQLSHNTTLSIGESFTLINFFLLFLCGLAIYYCAILIGSCTSEALLSVALYYLSFSTLFAFFPPIYSYDEPLQYLLIYLGLMAALRNKWTLYILMFSLAIIARESTLILLPGLALLTVHTPALSVAFFKKVAILLIPAVVYVIYLYFFITLNEIGAASKQDFQERLKHFYGNFRDLKFAIESVASFFLASGLQTYLLYSYASRKSLSPIEKKYVKAFVFTLLINTVIVILTTYVRETRLFALPLIFLFPLMGRIVLRELNYIRWKLSVITRRELIKYLPLFLILSAVCITVTYKYYFQTIGSQAENLFNEYTAIVLLVTIVHFLLRFVLKPEKPHLYTSMAENQDKIGRK